MSNWEEHSSSEEVKEQRRSSKVRKQTGKQVKHQNAMKNNMEQYGVMKMNRSCPLSCKEHGNEAKGENQSNGLKERRRGTKQIKTSTGEGAQEKN